MKGVGQDKEGYTSVVPSWLRLVVVVGSLKGRKGVGEWGKGREAVEAGRSSIHSQSSCTRGRRKGQ